MKMEIINSTNNSRVEDSTVNVSTIPSFLSLGLYIFYIVFGLIIVTGFVCNIFTVVVISRNKGIKSITDILVLNFAVSDILVIAVIIVIICARFGASNLSFGELWCRLIPYIVFACNYASVYMLVLISTDRYLALVHPIRSMQFRTKRNCYIQITVIWSIILLGNMPMIFENQLCSTKDQQKLSFVRIFLISSFMFEFVLPLLLMCVLHGHILIYFHTAKIPGVNNTTSRVRLITNRRVTKMVIIAMIVFIICRLPFHALLLYRAFVIYIDNAVVIMILETVALCMIYLNCCINPILYRSHSKMFRKGFRDVLRCKT